MVERLGADVGAAVDKTASKRINVSSNASSAVEDSVLVSVRVSKGVTVGARTVLGFNASLGLLPKSVRSRVCVEIHRELWMLESVLLRISMF